jgi:hypothetical protein
MFISADKLFCSAIAPGGKRALRLKVSVAGCFLRLVKTSDKFGGLAQIC